MTVPKPPPSSAWTSRWRRRLPRRFVVVDRSMEPTLTDGQGLVAIPSGRASPGQLRCLEHPDREGFWLVKRVDAIHDDATTGDAMMTILSDNRSATMADSRSFGPVRVAGSYRVVLKIPRRLM